MLRSSGRRQRPWYFGITIAIACCSVFLFYCAPGPAMRVARAADDADQLTDVEPEATVDEGQAPEFPAPPAAPDPAPADEGIGDAAVPQEEIADEGANQPEPVSVPSAEGSAPVEAAPEEASGARRSSTDIFAAGLIDISAINRGQPEAGQAASLQGVQPGRSTWDEVVAAWGEPARVEKQGSLDVAFYQLHGFRQVDVVTEDKRVKTVIVHLAEPQRVADLAERAKCAPDAMVEVVDELGNNLGLGIPELGLLCGFRDPERAEITEMVIEPISGELFRMRAEQSHFARFQSDLVDLDHAIRLNPDDADAHWHKAELLMMAGQFTAALEHADRAVSLDPQSALYRLTQARLWFEAGKVEEARRQVQEISERTSELGVIRAMAEQHMGDLYALGPSADLAKAIQHHMRAIELAAPLLGEERFAQRRLAKRVLINSHLAVAIDVALGNYQKREEAVPKWLQQATDLTEDFIDNDSGDPSLRMDVYRATLQALATVGSSTDPSVAAEAAITEAREMLESSQDPIYRSRVELLLAETLFHAARIERSRGEMNQCRNYINNALALVEPYQNEDRSSHDKYLIGQILFLTGSLSAVAENDHQEAVKWFERAAPLLLDRNSETPAMDVVNYGELFVSMGVSFWESGAREQAIELTRYGVDSLQLDVRAGRVPVTTLMIPYGNLAAMYGQVGDTEEAKRYNDLVARMQPKQVTR